MRSAICHFKLFARLERRMLSNVDIVVEYGVTEFWS
jgi:hypothetical protein